MVLGLLLSNHSIAGVVDELNELNDLFKTGVISKEEFTKAKRIILEIEETTNKKEIKKKEPKVKEVKKEIKKEEPKVKEVKKEIKKEEPKAKEVKK
jgi:multidrug resistance efflux pump